MAGNPITDLDLEAYCRRTLLVLNAWEKDLIFRLDDALLGIMATKPDKETPGDAEADVKDPKAVRGLLSGIRDRMAKMRRR